MRKIDLLMLPHLALLYVPMKILAIAEETIEEHERANDGQCGK